MTELDSSNAWAVGRFDALANQAHGCPPKCRRRCPPISWFSAAGHINGGVSGVFKAEARDDESAQNLRDMLRGFLALAKMQAGSQPGHASRWSTRCSCRATARPSRCPSRIPSEFFDALEAMAKQKHLNGR